MTSSLQSQQLKCGKKKARVKAAGFIGGDDTPHFKKTKTERGWMKQTKEDERKYAIVP